MSVSPLITRDMLAQLNNPRLIQAFEDQSLQVAETATGLDATATETETIKTAPVLTYGASTSFDNERILTAGEGIQLQEDGGNYVVSTSKVPLIDGDRSVTLVTTGDTVLLLPEAGTLATMEDLKNISLLPSTDAAKLNGEDPAFYLDRANHTGSASGWSAATGTATRTAFDTATATTTQLSERLKAVVDDLISLGLLTP